MPININGSKGIRQNTTEVTKIPVGTTAQRPANPEAGMMRFNTDTAEPEWYEAVNGVWVAFKDSTAYQADFLVVAGGGGGGRNANTNNRSGGGGGAGGIISSEVLLTPDTEYSIIVGSGGAGATSVNGSKGGDTTAFGFTVEGGGFGGGNNASNVAQDGGSGGSGGGGSGGTTHAVREDDPTFSSGGSGTSSQGRSGGGGRVQSTGGSGGGGGGFSENGKTAGNIYNTDIFEPGVGSGFVEVRGGFGFVTSISGINSEFSVGGNSWPATLSTGTPSNGAANTGNGGQGARDFNAGNGGSGVVIIRYSGPQRGTGGTVTSADGFTIHTFTSSGTFTA